MKNWKTACPLNCFDVCGFIVTTDNNQILTIDGDNSHPISNGKICGKGKMIKDRMYHQDRLLYPLKKVGDSFIRITWNQALDEISNKMLELKREYGPTAILHSFDYSSGGLLKGLDERFFNYFGGMTEVIGSLCWGAGKEGQIFDMGNALSHDVNDIKNAKTIVVWGRNVTTTNMHLYPFLMEAKERGAKLIVVDPIKNDIAKQADVHINIHPGMDGLLALAISKVIIDNQWHDKDFITHYSVGFEEFKREINFIDLGEISREIDISIETIYEMAEIYAKKGPVMTFLGLGMQRYGNGGNTVRAIDALAALTGNIGKSGGGVNYANLAVGQSFNWGELLRDDLRKDYRTFTRATQAEEIIAATNPPIKMMFISRSNAVVQLPNIKRTIKALNQVETKIVFDMYMTDTAKLADYILPIASAFEEEDIYYGSMFHGIVRYGPKMVEPPGEVWSDLEIWTSLAKRLGLEGFEKSIDEYFQIALKKITTREINLERLKKEGQFKLAIEEVPYKDKKFQTPSGKYEFYSELAIKKGLEPIAKIKYPNEAFQGEYPYNLLTIHPKQSLHSQHFPFLKERIATIFISEKIANQNNISDGQNVVVYNERGNVEGIARIMNGLNQATILMEEGLGLHHMGAANYVTSNASSDMGNGSTQYDCAVAIKINR